MWWLPAWSMYKLQKREQRVHYYIMLAILMHHLSFIAGHIDICNKVPTRSRGLEQAQDVIILVTWWNQGTKWYWLVYRPDAYCWTCWYLQKKLPTRYRIFFRYQAIFPYLPYAYFWTCWPLQKKSHKILIL